MDENILIEVNLLSNCKDAQARTLRLRNIGKIVCEQLSTIDNNKLVPALKKEVNDLVSKLHEIDKNLVDKENLQNEKDRLEKDFAGLNELQNKLEVLRKQKKFLEENNPDIIHQNIVEITNSNNEKVKEYSGILVKLSKDLPKAITSLTIEYAENLKTVEKNFAQLIQQQDNLLEQLSVIRLPDLIKFETELNQAIIDYNTYAKRYNKFKTEEQELIKMYRLHHHENERIYEALVKRKEETDKLEKINSDVAQYLKKYDTDLKIIIEKRDHLPIFQLAEINSN